MFRPIRRKEKEMPLQKAQALLQKGRRGVLAVNGDDGYPYAVPINYFYNCEAQKIYFHSARAGHKFDALCACDKVCLTVYGNETRRENDWAPFVQCAIAFGRCRPVQPGPAAAALLRQLALKYYPSEQEVDEEIARCGSAAQIFEITIEHLNKIILSAKRLPFSQKTEVRQGAFLKDDKIVVKYDNDECDIFLKELALGGRHNIYNSMAAALAAKASGIDNKTIREALATFQPIEHRLEPVLSIKDVLYINDSKATNVDAAWYALECQKRPVVWIVGGTDKGNDYEILKPLVKEKVKAIVCLGVDNRKIHEAFEQIVGKDSIVDTKSADEAVKAASGFAKAGDIVLLSPCCASFDLFTCYEDRGEKFKEAVRRL